MADDTVKAAAAIGIDKLTAGLTAEQRATWAPILSQYGPALAAMTYDEIVGWINRAVAGDPYAMFQALLAKMPPADVVAQWGELEAKWKAANQSNAANCQWQRDAMGAVLKVLMAVAISAVGL